MNSKQEAKIRREIRRRAFDLRDRLRHERERQQTIEHTLGALSEVTELSPSQLEAIKRDIRLSGMCQEENFFSIKNQIFAAGAICASVIILGWLIVHI